MARVELLSTIAGVGDRFDVVELADGPLVDAWAAAGKIRVVSPGEVAEPQEAATTAESEASTPRRRKRKKESEVETIEVTDGDAEPEPEAD